ncbi:MAG: hypothetical protein AB9866_03670 [Syntrophobacteraceae bacterium]
MNSDELFDRFPDLLFGSLRKQMLMGIVPAETVKTILEPLLSDFYALMLQLPPELQIDFENILRIYPDIAGQFDLRITPPLIESLLSLAVRHTADQDFTGSRPVDPPLDYAAEEQKELAATGEHSAKEGQGFFRTDRGNSVYIEFSYQVGDDCIYFVHKPEDLQISLIICGIHTLTLGQKRRDHMIPVDRLLRIIRESGGGLTLEAMEE